MPNSAPPRVFAIGLPHSGGAVLAALFEANGYKWDHHKSGKLAQDLAYAQATGTMPFVGRESVVGFSDIYRMHKRHLPPLAVQDYWRFYCISFPTLISLTRDGMWQTGSLIGSGPRTVNIAS